MRYGLIGCGRISPNHIVAAKSNGLDVVGICDLDTEKMKLLAKEYELFTATQYTDYHDLLLKEDPDLIAIATWSGEHARIAIECIEHGCNVIIEKPIALSLRDADAIIAASKKNNVVVSICHQNRFNKSIRYIREALEAGRFGKLSHGCAHVRWNRNYDYYMAADWRGTWKQDGGCLMNQCIHNIDLLRWMLGNEIIEVMAYTDRLFHPYIEAEDLGLAIIRFANGAYGLIEGTTNIYPKNLEETLYLFGQNGSVKAGGMSDNIIEEWSFRDRLDDPIEVKKLYGENPPNVYGYGHTPLYTDVITSITSGKIPYITAEDGRRALELVLAIYKSSAEHSPVQFPIEDTSTEQYGGLFDTLGGLHNEN